MSKPINPIMGGPSLAGGEALPTPGTPGSPATGYPDGNIAPTDGNFLLHSADSRFPNGVVFPGIIIPGGAPPDTRYGWLDTSGSAPLPKYFNGTAWVSWVGAQGDAASDWSPLTANFTAGAVGDTSLLVDVDTRGWFPVWAYVQIADNSGTEAFYRVTDWSTDPLHPQGLILKRIDGGGPAAATGYLFTVANSSRCTLSALPGGSSSSGGGHWELLVVDGDTVMVDGDFVYVWVD